MCFPALKIDVFNHFVKKRQFIMQENISKMTFYEKFPLNKKGLIIDLIHFQTKTVKKEILNAFFNFFDKCRIFLKAASSESSHQELSKKHSLIDMA